MFDIAAPVEGTAVTTADGNGAFIADQTNGDAIGDCVTDSFSITSPGNVGTPVICGFNSGQHSKYCNEFWEGFKLSLFIIVIVDASDSCIQATFTLGSNAASRSWKIGVTQHGKSNRVLVGESIIL